VNKKGVVSFLVFSLLVLGGFGVFSKLYVKVLGGQVLGEKTRYRGVQRTGENTSATVTSDTTQPTQPAATQLGGQSGGQAVTTTAPSATVTSVATLPTATQGQATTAPSVTMTPEIRIETRTETKYVYITVAPERREAVNVVLPPMVTPPPNQIQGTTQTLKYFFKSIGLPVTPKVINIEPEVIEKTEEVITPREAGEILKELESVSGADKDNAQVRLRFKPKGAGDTTLVAEVQVGQDILLNEREVERIKTTLNHGTDLKVTSMDEGFGFSKGVVNVETKLPLLLDLRNNTLTTEVSTGIKSVSILPDTAIDNALVASALSGVKSTDSVIMVEREDGKLAYRISGDVNRKLFGIFKTKTGKTVEVSAESGRVLPLDTNLGDIILDWLAPKAN